MSYNAVPEMAESEGLKRRLVGAAAQEGRADAKIWVEQNIYSLVSHTDWVTDWSYAQNTKTINNNPDTGARDDVINDAKLLSSVQALITAQAEPTP